MSLFDVKSSKNQEFTPIDEHAVERGSIIVWIFIMIGLLGALYFTFAKGFRAGENQISDEQANLYAAEILDYAQSIKQAVQTLQINGCDESEISFDNPTVTIYNFPSTPADESCKVFKPNGGGMRYVEPNSDYIDPDIPYDSQIYHTEWSFFGDHCISEIGNCDSGVSQLQMVLTPIKRDLCLKINEIMGDTSGAIPTENWSASKGNPNEYFGSYRNSGAQEISTAVTNGKMSGCYRDIIGVGDGYHVFYQVLIVR